MKKLVFLWLFFVAINVSAQTTSTKQTNTKIDENTVVLDEQGNALAYKIWQAFLRTGDYSLKRTSANAAFQLYRMTPQEKAISEQRKLANMVNLPRPMLSKAFTDGEKFKPERFTDINGEKFDLKKDNNKIYVINFWFINCPPCKQEIPELNELVEKYKDNTDVVFLAVALDEKYELKQFLKTTPFLYHIVEGRFYADKYGVQSFPTHVVVGKDGLVKFQTMGLASNTVYWINKTIKESL